MFSNETITKKINPTTILLSQQADFIMHRIESITQFGDYTFLLASPTPLNQIILYADFKYAQLEPLNISTFNEHIPNDNLLQMAINNTNNKNRLFSLDLYSKTSYKCLGGKKQFNMYNNKTQEIETLSIIVSSNNLTSTLKNGDIIYSSKSSGYLERILSIEFIRYVVSYRIQQETITSSLYGRLNGAYPAKIILYSVPRLFRIENTTGCSELVLVA